MKNIILIDQNGWADGVIYTECDFRETDHPNHKCIEVKDELATEIAHNGPIIWHDGSSFRRITDKKRIWRRLREQGLVGSSCSELHQELVEKGSGGKIIGELSQIPLSPSIVVTKTYPPIFAVELQPGLVYREAIENDLDVWEKQIIQSGLYEKEDAWIQAATWLSDPLIWCITTIWRDEIIQIECYHFDKDKDTKVWGGFASHIDRTRPHWFWTKMSKILFKAFAE